MKIDLNKDFETQFKTDIWKGFSGSEVAWGAAALVLSGIVVFLVWHFTDMPINICVYFGVPVMIPVVGFGIAKYQGHSMVELLRECSYFLKTRELCTEEEERNRDRDRIFTMTRTLSRQKRKKGGLS